MRAFPGDLQLLLSTPQLPLFKNHTVSILLACEIYVGLIFHLRFSLRIGAREEASTSVQGDIYDMMIQCFLNRG